MKRIIDLVLTTIAIVLFSVPILIIAILVKVTSPGPIIYWSDRVGQNNQLFQMPKFRSMRVNAPEVATHMLKNPNAYLTPVGSFLRRSSLDELPQLWSVLKGELSLVGPRPALFNQYDLVELRTQFGVQKLRPGLTGWAQINGRDELPILQKVEFDVEYLHNMSNLFDLKILMMSILKVIQRTGVSH